MYSKILVLPSSVLRNLISDLNEENESFDLIYFHKYFNDTNVN